MSDRTSRHQSAQNRASAENTGTNPVPGFTDQRPEAIAQRRILETISRSSQVKQLQVFQNMVDGRPGVTGPALQMKQAKPSGPFILQRVPTANDRNHLGHYITHNHYNAGALTGMDYNNMQAGDQTTLSYYLERAALQHASTFFHENAAHLLPSSGWESRECSRYIEFNIAFAAYNRVIYDTFTGNVYLTPHYNGYIRVDNVPGAVVAHLEGIADTNIGYLFDESMDRDSNGVKVQDVYAKVMAGDAKAKVEAYRVQLAEESFM